MLIFDQIIKALGFKALDIIAIPTDFGLFYQFVDVLSIMGGISLGLYCRRSYFKYRAKMVFIFAIFLVAITAFSIFSFRFMFDYKYKSACVGEKECASSSSNIVVPFPIINGESLSEYDLGGADHDRILGETLYSIVFSREYFWSTYATVMVHVALFFVSSLLFWFIVACILPPHRRRRSS